MLNSNYKIYLSTIASDIFKPFAARHNWTEEEAIAVLVHSNGVGLLHAGELSKTNGLRIVKDHKREEAKGFYHPQMYLDKHCRESCPRFFYICPAAVPTFMQSYILAVFTGCLWCSFPHSSKGFDWGGGLAVRPPFRIFKAGTIMH